MTWRGSMPDQSFVPLPGSERAELPGAVAAGAVNGAERIEVTLILRRRQPLPETGGVPARLSREELRGRHGADPADASLVASVLTRLGLQVTASDTGSRRITVAGPVSALAETFGAELSLVSSVAPPGPGQAGPPTPPRQAGRCSTATAAAASGSLLSWTGSCWRCSAWTTGRRHGRSSGSPQPPQQRPPTRRRRSPLPTGSRPAPTAPAGTSRSSSLAAGSR